MSSKGDIVYKPTVSINNTTLEVVFLPSLLTPISLYYTPYNRHLPPPSNIFLTYSVVRRALLFKFYLLIDISNQPYHVRNCVTKLLVRSNLWSAHVQKANYVTWVHLSCNLNIVTALSTPPLQVRKAPSIWHRFVRLEHL